MRKLACLCLRAFAFVLSLVLEMKLISFHGKTVIVFPGILLVFRMLVVINKDKNHLFLHTGSLIKKYLGHSEVPRECAQMEHFCACLPQTSTRVAVGLRPPRNLPLTLSLHSLSFVLVLVYHGGSKKAYL